MRICILITTYRRNPELFRLLDQCRALVLRYTGPNQYRICVTDSDPANAMSSRIQTQCDQYVLNPGSGFDDNLLGFYERHLSNFDYLLSVSDDDIFSPSDINSLLFLDSAVNAGADAVLFNHYDFRHNNDGTISMGNPYYASPILQIDKKALFNSHLRSLPRHIGLMYSVPALLRNIDKIAQFKNTLHLYAAPFLFAARDGSACFANYPLLCFSNNGATDGAWEHGDRVFNGLLRFAKVLKQHLSSVDYSTAISGFMSSYFASHAWLRIELIRRGYELMPEHSIAEHLA